MLRYQFEITEACAVSQCNYNCIPQLESYVPITIEANKLRELQLHALLKITQLHGTGCKRNNQME